LLCAALRQYKANLAVMNSRYGELERWALELFAEQPCFAREVFESEPEKLALDFARGVSIALPRGSPMATEVQLA
jgi:hypothetical protein